MKAWKVQIDDIEWAYVLAETGRKAKLRALREHPVGWTPADIRDMYVNVAASRYSALDGDKITEKAVWELGLMWIECMGCHGTIGVKGGDGGWYDDPYLPSEDVIWIGDWTGFHNQECYGRFLYRGPAMAPLNEPRDQTILFLSSEQ